MNRRAKSPLPTSLWIESEGVDIALDIAAWSRGAFRIDGIGGACANCGHDLAETGTLAANRGTFVRCSCGHTFDVEECYAMMVEGAS